MSTKKINQFVPHCQVYPGLLWGNNGSGCFQRIPWSFSFIIWVTTSLHYLPVCSFFTHVFFFPCLLLSTWSFPLWWPSVPGLLSLLQSCLSNCPPHRGYDFFQGKKAEGFFCSCFMLKRGSYSFRAKRSLLCQRGYKPWAWRDTVMVFRGAIPWVQVGLVTGDKPYYKFQYYWGKNWKIQDPVLFISEE